MKPYYHLPEEQPRVQALIDMFNGDEILWHSIINSRKQGRKSPMDRIIDRLEFETLRYQDDRIGSFLIKI